MCQIYRIYRELEDQGWTYQMQIIFAEGQTIVERYDARPKPRPPYLWTFFFRPFCLRNKMVHRTTHFIGVMLQDLDFPRLKGKSRWCSLLDSVWFNTKQRPLLYQIWRCQVVVLLFCCFFEWNHTKKQLIDPGSPVDTPNNTNMLRMIHSWSMILCYPLEILSHHFLWLGFRTTMF